MSTFNCPRQNRKCGESRADWCDECPLLLNAPPRAALVTYEGKLNEIREDLKHMGIQFIKLDEPETAQLAIVADLAICELMNRMSSVGYDESEWDRPLGEQL